MSASAVPLDALLLRWRTFSQADRTAILRHLPSDRQAELSQALARVRAEGQSARGHYAAYSPWLAELLLSCATDASLTENSPLRPLAREALREGQAKAEEAAGAGKPSSLLDLIRAGLTERGLLP